MSCFVQDKPLSHCTDKRREKQLYFCSRRQNLSSNFTRIAATILCYWSTLYSRLPTSKFLTSKLAYPMKTPDLKAPSFLRHQTLSCRTHNRVFELSLSYGLRLVCFFSVILKHLSVLVLDCLKRFSREAEIRHWA